VRHKKVRKKHITQVRHKKVEKYLYLKCGTEKWRKTHTSSEAQKSEEKVIPEVRHKKSEKNSYLK
jgi:hypothetical protein